MCSVQERTAVSGDWLGKGQSDWQDRIYGIIMAGDVAHEKQKYGQDLSTRAWRELFALVCFLFPPLL